MSLDALARKIVDAARSPLRSTYAGTTYGGNAVTRQMAQLMGPPSDYRAKVAATGKMDREDGRVKRILSRIAGDATRGGFRLAMREGDDDARLMGESKAFIAACGLDIRTRRKAHARSLLATGELWLQWVLDEAGNISGCKLMPSETMKAVVDEQGKFKDMRRAFIQHDPTSGAELAAFARWQITFVALDGNPDDPGERGRPLFDALITKGQQLFMTEEDLVIRRRVRAPMRFLHVLENAQEEEINAYRERNKSTLEDPFSPQSDFFSNRKGTISAIQGDGNLAEIGDVEKIEDDFYAGLPAPKFLFGKAKDISRDVFEDALEGYYEFLEDVQEMLVDAYEEGFKLQLLLKGINPDALQWDFQFQARTVESESTKRDRLLKEKALGVPPSMLWPQMGYDPQKVREIRDKDRDELEPYPLLDEIDGEQGNLTIVQGNKRKKESAVTVGNK